MFVLFSSFFLFNIDKDHWFTISVRKNLLKYKGPSIRHHETESWITEQKRNIIPLIEYHKFAENFNVFFLVDYIFVGEIS